MEKNRERSGRAVVSHWVQVMLSLTSLVLGVVLSAIDGTIAAVVFIILGAFGLTLAAVQWRQSVRTAEPKRGARQDDEPPVGRLYIAISGILLFTGAGYMFYQGSRYRAEDNPMAIVGFPGGLLATALGLYVVVGLFLSRRKASGKFGRLTARLYPKLADRAERGRPRE